MKKYDIDAHCFDDILLVPRTSNVISRHAVDLTMTLGGANKITLKLPVIAAPMDTVCDEAMCLALSGLGGLGILHRYMKIEDMVQKTRSLTEKGAVFGVSVGATGSYLDDAVALVEAGAKVILIDIANGHSHFAHEAVAALRGEFGGLVHIMSGNVATADGFKALADAGADSVRVGIGGGSACTTRLVSGHGVPTLASLLDIASKEYDGECSVIADGGIRTSGDMVKCFAAGAKAVMVGSMLAGTDESPGEVLHEASGAPVKIYRGMASAAAQKDATGKVSVAEGVSTTIAYKGPVAEILSAVKGGLGSGCSYSGVDDLADLAGAAKYVVVSELSVHESRPHALTLS